MTDHELDEVLRQIKTEFPNARYHRVHSQLVEGKESPFFLKNHC